MYWFTLGVLPILLAVAEGATIWSCYSFPGSNPLGGCNWRASHLHWGSGNFDSVPNPSGTGRALRVRYPKDSWVRHPSGGDLKGGTQFTAQAFPSQDTVDFEYEVFFANNFDFVRGGKLPGLKGGFGSCSGGNHDDTCFSLRLMWRRNGDGEVYAYMPAERGNWFCSRPENHCDFNYGHSLGRGTWKFVKNRWQKIRIHTKLNTSGSQSDGSITVTVDGSQVHEINGLRIRKNKTIKADEIYFSTFFGGSTQDWQSTRTTYTYFRQFKIIT